MADVFISYARTDKVRVAPLVKVIEARGWSVWWDPEITPGQEFDDQIDGELMSAKAVLVVWTPASVVSRWVRGEARDAADRNVLVPVRFENARLPIDVRAIHTTDLDDWHGDPTNPQVQACMNALTATIARSQAVEAAATPDKTAAPMEQEAAHYSVCVLPFTNMSGDKEQEYFSDGITEDIITDLGKISALSVISRNSSFTYKGQNVDVRKVARELEVTHVLEGSVRRAGGRIRINTQLIDGANNRHVWAERYDREADDIFALQDEISHAIVKALRLQLLPEERRAIRRRGTDSVEAHDLYLMARQMYITGADQDAHTTETIVRLCTRMTEMDPRYAQAWALMAVAYRILRELKGGRSNEGMQAADRALVLNPDLAEAHAVKAQILQADGDADAAAASVATALKLDPESYEVNRAAARLSYQQGHYNDAIRYYEKAASLLEADAYSAFMLISCYSAAGDPAGAQRAARRAVERADAILDRDPNNGTVMVFSASALATLGETERARARLTRAVLLDPENFKLRYNCACILNLMLRDEKATLEMLRDVFATMTDDNLAYIRADPDFESLHGDPRWRAMVAATEARLAAEKATADKAGSTPE